MAPRGGLRGASACRGLRHRSIGCHVAWMVMGRRNRRSVGVATHRIIAGSIRIPDSLSARYSRPSDAIYEFIQSQSFCHSVGAKKKRYPPGSMFWLYLILAGLARAMVEIWRINPPVALGMSEAQWFGLALAVIGCWLLLRTKSRVA